jgi:hypothetical protein
MLDPRPLFLIAFGPWFGSLARPAKLDAIGLPIRTPEFEGMARTLRAR